MLATSALLLTAATPAGLEEVARGVRFGEGPVLSADGTRLWVAAYAHTVALQRPGEAVEVLDVRVRLPAGLALDGLGRLLIAEFGGGCISRVDLDSGAREVLADSFSGRPLNAPNDLVVDDAGGVWFTDPALLSPNRQRDQQVFHLAPDGELRRGAGGLRVPNGLALIDGGETLLVAEFGAGRIWRYPVLGPGELGEPTRFTRHRTPTPDGMCVHGSSGRVFVATGRDVAIFDREGDYLGRVGIPGDPTNCAIAGERMLVTTRARVFEVDVPP